MNEIITEKTYPIQYAWVLKPAIWKFLPLLPLTMFLSFFLGNGYITVAVVVLVVSYNFLQILIVAIRRNNFHYEISDNFLVLRQGIISKQQRHIPYGVIQHVYIKQDILDRMLGLSSVSVENASVASGYAQMNAQTSLEIGEMIGFSGNFVNIPGLKNENAETLKSTLLERMKANASDPSQSGL